MTARHPPAGGEHQLPLERIAVTSRGEDDDALTAERVDDEMSRGERYRLMASCHLAPLVSPHCRSTAVSACPGRPGTASPARRPFAELVLRGTRGGTGYATWCSSGTPDAPLSQCHPVTRRVPWLAVMTKPDLPERGDRRPRARRRPPGRTSAIDTAIAVAVTAAQLAARWRPGIRTDAPPGSATDVLLIVSGLALIARRRYPVAVLAVTQAAALAVNAIADRRGLDRADRGLFHRGTGQATGGRDRLAGHRVPRPVWPPWLIGQHGHTTAAAALGLAAWLLFLLSVAELVRGRNQRAADAQRARAAELRRGPARSACRWPGTCMTW